MESFPKYPPNEFNNLIKSYKSFIFEHYYENIIQSYITLDSVLYFWKWYNYPFEVDVSFSNHRPHCEHPLGTHVHHLAMKDKQNFFRSPFLLDNNCILFKFHWYQLVKIVKIKVLVSILEERYIPNNLFIKKQCQMSL